jgi:hypothetical protein
MYQRREGELDAGMRTKTGKTTKIQYALIT